MKSRWRIFPVIYFVLLIFLSCGSFVQAIEMSDEICVDKEGILSRCKSLEDDIVCVENYNYSPEIKRIKIHNLVVYKKKIDVSRKYIKKEDSKSKFIASSDFTVSFTYDKKSSVKSEVKIKNTTKGLGILKVLFEKFCDNGLELVSTKYIVSEKGSLSEYKYLMDGHCDIGCTSNGEILINSDVH